MKKTFAVFLPLFLMAIFGCNTTSTKPENEQEFYQIKIYHVSSLAQEASLDSYLKNAYLPAVHRAGISDVGVFKTHQEATENDTTYNNSIYVFTPFSSSAEFLSLDKKLTEDEAYQKSGASYLNAPFDNPAFDRQESILLSAFDKHPRHSVPNLTSPRESRLYELRSYESPTEKLHQNKMDMFNDGDEIGIFDKLGFNAVFYGHVISGSHMPNLMYMTTHDNKAAQDAHWQAFGNDPHWKELIADTSYANNVSHIDIFLLYPTEYSDF